MYVVSELVGRYKLKSHGIYDSKGNYTATSDYINGELNYGSDGSLSVLILFKEKPQNTKELLSYLGRFRVVDEKTLFHDISLCNNQDRNNSQERREYLLRDNDLILTAPQAGASHFEAVWEKHK